MHTQDSRLHQHSSDAQVIKIQLSSVRGTSPPTSKLKLGAAPAEGRFTFISDRGGDFSGGGSRRTPLPFSLGISERPCAFWEPLCVSEGSARLYVSLRVTVSSLVRRLLSSPATSQHTRQCNPPATALATSAAADRRALRAEMRRARSLVASSSWGQRLPVEHVPPTRLADRRHRVAAEARPQRGPSPGFGYPVPGVIWEVW